MGHQYRRSIKEFISTENVAPTTILVKHVTKELDEEIVKISTAHFENGKATFLVGKGFIFTAFLGFSSFFYKKF